MEIRVVVNEDSHNLLCILPGLSSCIIFIRKLFNCDLQKVTFQKAQEHSVKTARLPIQEYMVRRQNGKNYHSEILAINQGTTHMAH